MFAKSFSEFLETQGFGKRDVNIFVNALPSRVDTPNLIMLLDSQSFSVRGRERNSVNFRCQVRVRNDVDEEALGTAMKIYSLLERDKYITDLKGKKFYIKPLNPPTFLMYDEAGRSNWIMNVTGLSQNY